MIPKKVFFLLINLFWQIGIIQAQSKSFILHLRAEKSKESSYLNKLSYKRSHPDSVSAMNELEKVIQTLHQGPYLKANYTQVLYRKDSLIVDFKLGKSYAWKKLYRGNLEPNLASSVGFKEKYYQGKDFDNKELEALKSRILDYSEDHGYPFAAISLQDIQIKAHQVEARLHYEPGPEITFDSLNIVGKVKIRPQFLQKYLKIRPTQLFSQKKIDKAGRLLGQLPYLRVKQAPSVLFRSFQAYPSIYIDKARANQIDGILGILPNEETPGRVLITGEFNLRLQNPFGTGKSLAAKWQRLQSESQLLELTYLHPVFLGTNVDVEVDFDLLRQDSTFLNRDLRLVLFYNLPNLSKFTFEFRNRLSDLLGIRPITDNPILPEFSDVRLVSFGLGYQTNSLDDIFYPRRGQNLFLRLGIGNKTIQRENNLPDSLYAGIRLESTQLELRGFYEKYFPWRAKSLIKTKLDFGRIFNKNLFLNELYRVGGLQSLRGHNENTFFASTYAVLTLEYRLFFDQESFWFVFYDQGYIQQDLIQNFSEDYPLGIGTGISFSVKAGTFSLVYALGNSEGLPISFNRSKVHFGLVSRF